MTVGHSCLDMKPLKNRGPILETKLNESIPNVGPAGGVWQPIVRRPEEEGELGRVVTVIYGRVVRRLVAPRELLRRCGGERRCRHEGGSSDEETSRHDHISFCGEGRTGRRCEPVMARRSSTGHPVVDRGS